MYFEIFCSSNNQQYYFNIRGANHERIAQSEGYIQKQGAVNAIGVIKRDAAQAPVYDKTVSQSRTY